MPLAFPRRPSVPHCARCSQFMDALTPDEVAPSLKSFLGELWFEHQDRADNMLCWNAYMSVFDPSQIYEVDN